MENAMWMVPPQYAVWLPGSLPHSNHVTAGAELCFLLLNLRRSSCRSVAAR
ncbi:hypothetical protein SEEE4018_10222 [Salmonella enterica subsp. enterica serovar Enteritidis str. 543463 40-18]|nr:hypothetical protein SEEE4018_10222 [Salmonella enterica subsp. enterica serovar Enteritidis str. 543463 40-18]